MPVISVGTENSGPINLYYEDYGSGAPVVLIHGYPLSGRAWDKQVPPLLAAGRRVITYDRRGAGKSSQPASGYDWDTFAADLKVVIDELALDSVTLVGHSMGTGEVTRYLGNYGSSKVDRAGLIGPIPPYLSQAPDNAGGPAPVRAYAQELMPGILDGTIQPGKVFDVTTDLKGVPAGYQDMAIRTSLKVLIKP